MPRIAHLRFWPPAGFAVLLLASAFSLSAQHSTQPQAQGPIAIVPLDNSTGPDAARVTGALEVAEGKAVIVASGTIAAGRRTVPILLPRRGTLRVCASTTVKLAADASVPAGDTPGLLMALDRGAVEASFATGRNADILLTPDFRILVAGPGAAELRVRLGAHGDTCVDNGSGSPARADAPYVLVTSVFDGANYRVQPGQRVMFQHGSVHEVVDREKEPCGCPPPAGKGNDFPLAQSEGLEPTPKPTASLPDNNGATDLGDARLSVNGADRTVEAVAAPGGGLDKSSAATSATASAEPQPKKKSGFFAGIGLFFRRLFGAE
jgi:hypothetical protein